MTVYALATLSIHDRARYERYAARFLGVLARFDGRVLAADESPQVIEGTWDEDKVVIVAFDDRDAFEAWFRSPEYQEIAADRIASTESTILLVGGIARATAPGSRTGSRHIR